MSSMSEEIKISINEKKETSKIKDSMITANLRVTPQMFLERKRIDI